MNSFPVQIAIRHSGVLPKPARLGAPSGPDSCGAIRAVTFELRVGFRDPLPRNEWAVRAGIVGPGACRGGCGVGWRHADSVQLRNPVHGSPGIGVPGPRRTAGGDCA